MALYSSFNKVHELIRKNEKLIRLLFYKAESSVDDVLKESEARPNIVDALHNTSFLAGVNDNEHLTSQEIIDRVIKSHALTVDHLTNDSPQCALSITLEDFNNAINTPTGTTNIYVYDQKFNIDIYAHEEYQNVDMRLTRLLESLLYLFNPKQVVGLGAARFISSSKLDNIPNYEGVRVTFSIKWSI